MFLLNKLSVFLFLVFEFTENEFFQIKFSVVFYKFQNNFKFSQRLRKQKNYYLNLLLKITGLEI